MRTWVLLGAAVPAPAWPYPALRLDEPLQIDVEPQTPDLPDPPDAP
jgi:hypothetical protein